MRPHAHTGGRHELGQNFLTHRPTIEHLAALVSQTDGSILEIGAGDGALTEHLVRLGRDVRAIDIDARRVARLRSRLPGAAVHVGDALREPFDCPVLVGNIPFHLTTPILRRMLNHGSWSEAVLLTQWEVARKRAGVGGATMMTAQAAPWFTFRLEGRVAARHFRPMPAVDGGILVVARRPRPLIPSRDRRRYEAFIGTAFRGRGRGMQQILRGSGHTLPSMQRALSDAGAPRAALPRDLSGEQWAALWNRLGVGPSR
jgi:23S rRNA (adenine-N6)-dimethyltransferase